MTRIKPDAVVPAVKNLEEADSVLARIAALKRNLSLIEAAMNDEIDSAKRRASEEAEPYTAEIFTLEQALSRFAAYNKAEMFTKRKSLDLTFGVLGFRASSKLRLLPKHTWDSVLQALHDDGRTDLIRVKEEPDKEALKSRTPEYLKALGCRIIQEDIFFYELAEQALSPAAVPGDAA